MSTENTSLKNTTPAGDSTTSNKLIIGKINTYQRPLLIVAGSLLALLVLIAVAGKSGGQHLQSSAHENAKSAVALADYQQDSANSALTKDIFGLSAVSENDGGCIFGKTSGCGNRCWYGICLFIRNSTMLHCQQCELQQLLVQRCELELRVQLLLQVHQRLRVLLDK